jgi:oligopeptidase B
VPWARGPRRIGRGDAHGCGGQPATDLFAAIVAEDPFVDCLSTIRDESFPLTVTAWEEWGDPVTSRELYEYMKGYSPYNLAALPFSRHPRHQRPERPAGLVLAHPTP